MLHRRRGSLCAVKVASTLGMGSWLKIFTSAVDSLGFEEEMRKSHDDGAHF